MSSIGIIAEFNPFHNGHAYAVREARRISGAQNVVVCMSGSFVQRGEPGCFDKFTRARHALIGGADMVIEMPDILSCACAEVFAFGGIKLLISTGIVDGIAFGSETGDADNLLKAAKFDMNSGSIKEALDRGEPYAKAAGAVLGEGTLGPNDILAVEYIRQILRLSPDCLWCPIKRIGDYNDRNLSGMYSSASAIRSAVLRKDIDAVSEYVPAFVFEDIIRELNDGSFPASLDSLSEAALLAFRSLTAEQIAALPDVSEGLENLFAAHACSSSSVNEMLSKVKSKRYTMARLKRIVISALLGSTKELLDKVRSDPKALFIRVLGVRKEKLHLLSELSRNAELPVVKSFADIGSLGPTALSVIDISRKASRIHALAKPLSKQVADDFSHPLIIV